MMTETRGRNNGVMICSNARMAFIAFALMLPGLSKKAMAQDAENLLLKNYRPVSVFRIPATKITKARYPAIDVHAHDYAKDENEVETWVKKMDSLGIERTIVLTGKTGKEFDAVVRKYSKRADRFELWCGFDLAEFENEGGITRAIEELRRCRKSGARGVGEISDKGMGIRGGSKKGPHLDDPRLKPLFEECAKLNMPINVHVADPYWAYLPIDSTNDGLMSAYRWKIDLSKPGMLNHDALLVTLENVVKQNPKTTFIACHLANCDFDLERLGAMFDKYPNLFADISARYYQTASIPRTVKAFYTKYADRLLYGTDMSTDMNMYRFTLRVLETADEHFYFRYTYHWPLYGLDLSDDVLKKLYNENAKRILK